MNTDKKHIRNLAKICAAKGMQHVVMSPGSRCAPLVIAFNRIDSVNCLSIVDERSAAFFALGMAQQSQQPVGLVCTSGSAILNYAPAIAEAFYQKIPLVVITADRPNEWIDQGENQSIQQFEVYKNYIKKSFQLPVQIADDKDLWFSDRLVSEAMNASMYPDYGPVHINVPLREPLYELAEDKDPAPKLIHFPKSKFQINPKDLKDLQNSWARATKKLIVVGSYKNPPTNINDLLSKLAKDESVAVLTETISNVHDEAFVSQIDPSIELITQCNLTDFTPDIVLTFGGSVVSKKLKFWLRKNNPKAHWHVTQSFEHWDNFQSLSRVLQTEVYDLLKALNEVPKQYALGYKKDWIDLSSKAREMSNKYVAELPFTDFKVFDFLAQNFPNGANVHLGNSTPVRYANLLQVNNINTLTINSNRGVSGIDGVSSTAAGAAYFHQNQLTFVVTGDIAFMYDSNAIWNKHLYPNFKVILINNSGGNIFKIIPGPSRLPELETFFETHQKMNAAPLAKLHDLAYFSASDESSLRENWKPFVSEQKRPSILEIFTPNDLSANSLKNYFGYLVKAYKSL